MKTTTKSKRRTPVLLSILCAGLVTTFLGGCAEGPYVAGYDTGYYPAAYYTPYPTIITPATRLGTITVIQ